MGVIKRDLSVAATTADLLNAVPFVYRADDQLLPSASEASKHEINLTTGTGYHNYWLKPVHGGFLL